MAFKPRTDDDGNYLVHVNVDLVVDPAVMGYEVSASDLSDLLEAQLTRLDGVVGFNERYDGLNDQGCSAC
jgi:hypothetical protein